MATTIPPSIDALPAAPDPSNRATFNTLAYPWSAALPTFGMQVSAVATNVKANADDCKANSDSAAAQVVLATTQAGNSATSATLAASAALSAGAIAWVSGTTYALGDLRYSPIDFQTYRRKVAGAGTTDPSADTANWVKSVIILGVIPVGGLLAFANNNLANVVTTADGATYLKTGVVAPAASYPLAESAPYPNLTYTATSVYQPVSICHGNGLYFSVTDTTNSSPGANGVSSTDGFNWSPVTSLPISTSMLGSEFFNGMFCAVWSSGYLTSTDAVTWTTRTTPPTIGKLYVVNGKLFATPNSNASTTYAWSSDGLTWTSGTFNRTASSYWTGMAYANGVYIAIDGASANVIQSTTGLTGSWSNVTTPVTFSKVVSAGGYFVASSSSSTLYQSSDGVTWTFISTAVYGEGIANIYNLATDGTTVWCTGENIAYAYVWTGSMKVYRRLTSTNIRGTTTALYRCTHFDGTKLVSVLTGVAATSGVVSAYVVNDTNLKTYNATVADQTNFYKRVA